ncbi:MAG: zinc-ribbon domain-containing protein [Proteobacteria bacterium]|nr:zinc-ribbon domain-containing protein [Pseudomonadota bacterium]
MIVTCPKCKTNYKLRDDVLAISGQKKLRCNKCGYIFVYNFNLPIEGEQPLILVAHDDYRVVNVIKKVLEPIKCRIETAFEGNEAYKIVLSKKPAIAIIDVALTGLFGFELCEKIKKDPQLNNVKVILVASIYDRTRYKRRPQNLYGADDYIEKHHIPDDLCNKVISLLPENKKISVERDLKIQKEIEDTSLLKDNRDLLLEKTKDILKERDEIRKHEQASLEAIPESTNRAKKLARLIISDIALYNQEVLDKVTPDNFKEILKLDFEDAVKYLSQRIPEIKNDAQNFIEQAFIELLNKRKE